MSDSGHNLNRVGEPQGGVSGARTRRLRPVLVALLYLLLVSSAILALWARRFPGGLPAYLELAAPISFLAFVVLFTLYRLSGVRARKYPAFKAFFQIGAAALFFTLLLPRAKSRPDESLDRLEGLLTDSDPRVRALAAEVVGCRSDVKYGPLLVKALGDPDERVRTVAHQSLIRLSGRDLGDPKDEKALKAWEERFP